MALRDRRAHWIAEEDRELSNSGEAGDGQFSRSFRRKIFPLGDLGI